MPSAYKTCPRCHMPYPRSYFYSRSDGRLEYCLVPSSHNSWSERGCHGQYWALRRRARRRGPLRCGVEIEFVGNLDAVERVARETGLDARVEAYGHRVARTWRVVTDASVVSGGELVSPPMEPDDVEQQVRLACETLRRAECRVSHDCGLHVHLEVRGYTAAALRRVFREWHRHQSLLHAYVAPSRRNGEYCRDVSESHAQLLLGDRRGATDVEIGRGLSRMDRYTALNGTAYGKYGTIEVRLHQGTINADKILWWHEACRAFFTWASSRADDAAPLETHDALVEALTGHGLTAERAAYMHRRRDDIARASAERDTRRRERDERDRVTLPTRSIAAAETGVYSPPGAYAIVDECAPSVTEYNGQWERVITDELRHAYETAAQLVSGAWMTVTSTETPQ